MDLRRAVVSWRLRLCSCGIKAFSNDLEAFRKAFSKAVLLRSTFYETKEFSLMALIKWPWSISAIKGMLMKVCYFTSMKCIMFSNQIVFILFCFVLLLWFVCCTSKKHPSLPCAATINTLFFWGFFCFSEVFLFFFSLFLAEVIKAYSYQCRNTDETSCMWDTCKVSIGKRC